ncbi:hypothetical protein X970_05065 [Pseudomonas monteilii SB3101]|uniref:Uncharacterized protein n=1 Tax=Pseudomonas monteilii SB3101 TaxID=1435058 RepID=V9VAV6_9PSED|nr:hypothetical protein X969_05090 [Pseudomonas monteilii SB3078]AHC91030.1 hypothetical protein X970_05065 [Pseudomonas monteilii SB3101]
MWLIVSFILLFGSAYISPFSKAGTPPLIIFREGMKLRKIDGNRTNIYFCV